MAETSSVPSTEITEAEVPKRSVIAKRTIIYSLLLAVVSLFFWSWATYNNITQQIYYGNFDLGSLTFPFPFTAGVLGLVAATRLYGRKKVNVARAHRVFVIIGHVLMCFNYMIPIALRNEYPLKHFIYCCVFVVLWAAAGIMFTLWATKFVQECREEASHNDSSLELETP